MKKNKTILPIVLIFVSIASSALIHHAKGAENPVVLVSDGKTDTSISLSWEVEEIKWGINFEIYIKEGGGDYIPVHRFPRYMMDYYKEKERKDFHHNVTDLFPNTKYSFYIKYIKPFGSSDSNTIEVFTEEYNDIANESDFEIETTINPDIDYNFDYSLEELTGFESLDIPSLFTINSEANFGMSLDAPRLSTRFSFDKSSKGKTNNGTLDIINGSVDFNINSNMQVSLEGGVIETINEDLVNNELDPMDFSFSKSIEYDQTMSFQGTGLQEVIFDAEVFNLYGENHVKNTFLGNYGFMGGVSLIVAPVVIVNVDLNDITLKVGGSGIQTPYIESGLNFHGNDTKNCTFTLVDDILNGKIVETSLSDGNLNLSIEKVGFYFGVKADLEAYAAYKIVDYHQNIWWDMNATNGFYIDYQEGYPDAREISEDIDPFLVPLNIIMDQFLPHSASSSTQYGDDDQNLHILTDVQESMVQVLPKLDPHGDPIQILSLKTMFLILASIIAIPLLLHIKSKNQRTQNGKKQYFFLWFLFIVLGLAAIPRSGQSLYERAFYNSSANLLVISMLSSLGAMILATLFKLKKVTILSASILIFITLFGIIFGQIGYLVPIIMLGIEFMILIGSFGIENDERWRISINNGRNLVGNHSLNQKIKIASKKKRNSLRWAIILFLWVLIDLWMLFDYAEELGIDLNLSNIFKITGIYFEGMKYSLIIFGIVFSYYLLQKTRYHVYRRRKKKNKGQFAKKEDHRKKDQKIESSRSIRGKGNVQERREKNSKESGTARQVCVYCGSRMSDGEKFCRKCGKKRKIRLLPKKEQFALDSFSVLLNQENIPQIKANDWDTFGNVQRNGTIISLGFYKKNLRKMPHSLGNLINLEKLYVFNNKLNTLPTSLGKLTNLKQLWLNNNRLETLPESIGNLKSLETLNLEGNSLENLPKSISNLTNLTYMSLNSNNLKEFPEAITDINSLESLNLRGNGITKIPESIGKLKNLEELWLNDNSIDSLPKSMENLTSLKILYIKRNPLNSLTDSMENMLRTLKRKGCSIYGYHI